MANIYGVGGEDALGEVAQRLRLTLTETFAETRFGFHMLRQRLRGELNESESPMIVLAMGDSLSTENLVIEILRTEALGVSLFDPKGDTALESIIRTAAGRERGSSERAQKIRETMQRKAMRGLVLGRIPYGYQTTEGGSLEEMPGEVEVVQEIFALASEGKGIRTIVKELNTRGRTTRRGKPWSMTTIRDMLRNRVYSGTYERFGSRVSGNHPALVASSVFKAIQERMDARAQKAGYGQGGPFLLSGTAVCGTCGSRMIGVTQRQAWRRADGTPASKTYRYYQCEAATNQSRCSYHTRRTLELDEQVINEIGHDNILSASESAFNAGLKKVLAETLAGRRTADNLRSEASSLFDAFERLQQVVRTLGKASEPPSAVILGAAEEDTALRSLLRDAIQQRIERVVIEEDAATIISQTNPRS